MLRDAMVSTAATRTNEMEKAKQLIKKMEEGKAEAEKLLLNQFTHILNAKKTRITRLEALYVLYMQ